MRSYVRKNPVKLTAIGLLVFILVSLWWRGQDHLIKAVSRPPVFYFHGRVDSFNENFFRLIFDKWGIDVKKVKEFSLAAFEGENQLSIFLITPKSVDSEKSRAQAGVYFTALGDFDAQPAPAEVGPVKIKKPWIWFGQREYGFVNPEQMADLLKGQLPLGIYNLKTPFYFKVIFDWEGLRLSVLPANWQLGELLQYQPQNTLAQTKWPVLNLSSDDQIVYWGKGTTLPRSLLERSAGKSLTELFELSENKDWQTLYQWLEQAYVLLIVDQTSGGWFILWQPVDQHLQKVELGTLERGSRALLAELWPVTREVKLNDGTVYQELLADTGAYKWQSLDFSHASVYKADRNVAGASVYLGFKDNLVWLTNLEEMAKISEFIKFAKAVKSLPSLRQARNCLSSSESIVKNLLYLRNLGLNGISDITFVDKNGIVDICLSTNVDN